MALFDVVCKDCGENAEQFCRDGKLKPCKCGGEVERLWTLEGDGLTWLSVHFRFHPRNLPKEGYDQPKRTNPKYFEHMGGVLNDR